MTLTESMRPIDALDAPEFDFDWTEDTWQRVGLQALNLVAAASTDWDVRKPSREFGFGDSLEGCRRICPSRGVTHRMSSPICATIC